MSVTIDRDMQGLVVERRSLESREVAKVVSLALVGLLVAYVVVCQCGGTSVVVQVESMYFVVFRMVLVCAMSFLKLGFVVLGMLPIVCVAVVEVRVVGLVVQVVVVSVAVVVVRESHRPSSVAFGRFRRRVVAIVVVAAFVVVSRWVSL